MYAQHDPGSDVIVILNTLAKVLDIPVIQFQAPFCSAAALKEHAKAS